MRLVQSCLDCSTWFQRNTAVFQPYYPSILTTRRRYRKTGTQKPTWELSGRIKILDPCTLKLSAVGKDGGRWPRHKRRVQTEVLCIRRGTSSPTPKRTTIHTKLEQYWSLSVTDMCTVTKLPCISWFYRKRHFSLGFCYTPSNTTFKDSSIFCISPFSRHVSTDVWQH
jgi:hypothetical protein